jgi:hypothetical protein
MPSAFERGIVLRNGTTSAGDLSATGAIVEMRPGNVCGGVSRGGIFMHPPYKGGVGFAFAALPVTLPAAPPSSFRASVGKTDGSDPGDGIWYRVVVRATDGTETVAAETTVRDHAWVPIEADLSRWSGQSVTLRLVADVGAKDDSSGDWACWSEARVESSRPELRYHLGP